MPRSTNPVPPPARAQSAVAWNRADLQSDPHEAPDKADRVRTMFAAIARRYDLNNRLHSFGRDQAWRRTAVKLCNIQPTDDVLDAACGTGDLTLAFAKANPNSITGIDFTAEMLEVARAKTDLRVSQSKIQNPKSKIPSYLHADATNLPFPDSSFNVVSIAFGIRNISDPPKAIREFRRVLKVGGRLAVLEFSQPRNPIIRSLNNIYTSRIMPITASLIARDRSGAYRYLPKSVASFPNSHAFVEMLQANGFSNVQTHRLTLGVCTIYLAQS